MPPTLYEEVRAALRESEFRPRKRLGQNFLIHEHVIASILRLLELSPKDEIMEIGPGLGFLTRHLVERAAGVWAVEVDGFLVARLLRSQLGENPKFHLLHGDILKIPLDEALPRHRIKLVANLPYSISTPVLFRLFDLRHHFSRLILMLQREVAARVVGSPGTKAYGALSVWSQIHGRVVDRVLVSPEAFFPRPQVRSTILKLELFPEPLVSGDELPFLRALVRSAFGQRRKTLINALAAGFQSDRNRVETFLRAEAIDPQRRGETLSVEEFLGVARAMKRRGFMAPVE